MFTLGGVSNPDTTILDGFNRAVGVGDGTTGVWILNYDAEDRPTRVQAPTGEVTEIRYDAVGHTTDIIEPGGRISHFEYDERDSLSEARWATGDTARYDYDEPGDLSRAQLQPGDGGNLQVADYAHDGLHRIRRFVRYVQWPSPEAEVTEFGYSESGTCAAYHASP